MYEKTNKFLVSSVNELEYIYNFKVVSNYKIKLNKKNVPKQLWILIPYAEFFILSDQAEREDLMESIPQQALLDLKELIAYYDSLLDHWLGGEEAQKESFTEEYIYISMLRILSY